MIKFCSGFGEKHTPRLSKNPDEFLRLTLKDIKKMAEDPQDRPKEKAQWVIPSTHPSRVSKEQFQRGDRHFLTFDKDKNPEITFDDLINHARGVIPGDFIAYTSKGATEENQKARLIIPIEKPVSGEMGVILQTILNNRLEAVGVTPDRAMERPNQICYLPNRGSFYKNFSVDFLGPFNPLDEWAEDIAKIQEQIEAEKAARARQKAESIRKAAEMVKSGTHNVIEAFNHTLCVEFALSHYGYKRAGKKFISPNSESGNAGVSISDDGQKWYSFHDSDAGIGRRNGDGTYGDAWDLYKYYEHGNDQKAALHAAGNMFKTDDGISIEKANQIEWAQEKSRDELLSEFESLENVSSHTDGGKYDLSAFTLNGESDAMKKQMLEDKPILDDLALMGQWTVFYSKPNVGKTLLILWMINRSIAQGHIKGSDLFYVNADDTHKGLVGKLKMAEDSGFNMLSPGYKNLKAEMLTSILLGMIKDGKASGKILILDTLKKFTDLMDKKKSSQFAEIMRQFVLHGGSVITLGHTNKHRGSDGKVIHSGTSDIPDDADCAYTLDIVTDDKFTGERVVKFENFKNRGDVAIEVSYKYDASPKISYERRLNSISKLETSEIENAEKYRKLEKVFFKNKDVIDEIKTALEKPMKQNELIKTVNENSGFGRNKINRVLREHRGSNTGLFQFWTATRKEKNALVYTLN